MLQPVVSSPTSRAKVVTPILQVRREPLLIEVPGRKGSRFEERELPVLHLSFDYGGTVLPLEVDGDGFDGNDVGSVGTPGHALRDARVEQRAQLLLEGFGAVELGCVPELMASTDSSAHYLVSLDGNVHATCSFLAHAVPQLEALGWRVCVEEDFPYRVVAGGAQWYAGVTRATDDEDEPKDWFGLELGVEVDGRRVDLLPALLEILQRSVFQRGGKGRSWTSLFRGAAKFRALPVGGDRYVVLPPERLERLLRVVEDLYDPDEDAVGLPPSAAALLGHLDSAFDEEQPLEWRGDKALVERGRALVSGATDEVPPQKSAPRELRAELRPYQEQGLAWLQQLVALGAGGVLADDMGLGKTLQTIAHIATECLSGRATAPTLVVVPTSLVGNWQRELRKYAPFLKVVAIFGARRTTAHGAAYHADCVITSYPILVRDIERFLENDYHLVVLDEAQTIKNAKSQVSRAVKQIQGKHRLCLSGTPIENNLSELWSLFDFVMPGFLGNHAQFQARYRIPIETGQDEARLQQLRARVAPFILRRMKDTVATELPPKTEIVRPIELSGEQRDLYENIRVAAHSEVRSVIRKKGLAGSTVTILDALMKLRQVCCDPRLVKARGARDVAESAKLEFLLQFLRQQLGAGRRVLLFSQFTEMLAVIQEALGQAGIRHLLLTGSTNDRQAVCDQFERGTADVFLISLKAGGTGLNLVSADTVIHYDPWWNPAAQAQATDRAYRIGQTKPVFVYNLIVAGSVEERMLALQERKRHLANTILGGEVSGTLSEADVEDLFAPID
jgi:superfamily II DNA or RNA helicase